MTEAEFLTVIETVAALWPHTDMERRIVAGYRLLLANLPAEAVLSAIVDLARDGREFAPPPGVIHHRVEGTIAAAWVFGARPKEIEQ